MARNFLKQDNFEPDFEDIDSDFADADEQELTQELDE